MIGTFLAQIKKLSGNPIQMQVSKASESKNDKYQSARMSQIRLMALQGIGYRHCYMEKLREVAQTSAADTERWFKEADAELEHPVAAQERKRRERLLRAEQGVSHIRLTALVARMHPEDAEANEREGTRVQGSTWKIPRLEDQEKPK